MTEWAGRLNAGLCGAINMEKEMEELAIVKGVGFGMRDCSNPVLWFGVETLHGGSLQVFSMKESEQVIKDAALRHPRRLGAASRSNAGLGEEG